MSKYHSVKTVVNGIVFDSKKEAKRYYELLILERAGEIHDLKRQQKYILIPKQTDASGKCLERECTYRADFVYTQPDGQVIAEDVKGFRTQEYIIKRKLMLYVHGIRIKEY